MGRLIDADALIEEFEWLKEQSSEWRRVEIDEIIERINNQPTTDAVPKGLFDQIKWERDIAIGQLQEIGCELGQKMDGVKAKSGAVPAVSGRWEEWFPPKHMIFTGEEMLYRCSSCTAKYSDVEGFRYCPNCGARMDMEEE